jgi:hypothetical protein
VIIPSYIRELLGDGSMYDKEVAEIEGSCNDFLNISERRKASAH